MGHYRVAIVEMSQLMREIVVEALRSAEDIDVVADEPDLGRLRQVIATARPDVVLTGAEATRPSAMWAELQASRPRTRMIALTPKGGATSFALVPVEATTEDVSPAELIHLIRKAGEADPVN